MHCCGRRQPPLHMHLPESSLNCLMLGVVQAVWPAWGVGLHCAALPGGAASRGCPHAVGTPGGVHPRWLSA